MPFPESDPALWPVQLRGRLDELIDEYRALLHDCVNGLSEEEARMRLVPSKTTLLGLLKHVTYVEGVWFDQAVTGRPYQEIGIATTPDRSFTLASVKHRGLHPRSSPAPVRGVPCSHEGTGSRRGSRRPRKAYGLGPCVCRCSASSPSMPDMPTFCENKFSPNAPRDGGRPWQP